MVHFQGERKNQGSGSEQILKAGIAWASVKHRGVICSGSLRGELLCLWGLPSPLWSPDEPCTAVWSKEVIALWRKPQRPTRTIRIMCFWVTGAQFQTGNTVVLPSSGSGKEMAWFGLLPDAWDRNATLLCSNWFTLTTKPYISWHLP